MRLASTKRNSSATGGLIDVGQLGIVQNELTSSIVPLVREGLVKQTLSALRAFNIEKKVAEELQISLPPRFADWSEKTCAQKIVFMSKHLRMFTDSIAPETLVNRFATEFANTDDSLKIEMRHSLMWAESALFGFEHARVRWHELSDDDMNELDRRLIARDFLEIWLLLNAPWCADVETAHAQLETLTLTDFDRALPEYTVSNRPRGLSRAVTDVSNMSVLRLLLLQINAATDLSL